MCKRHELHVHPLLKVTVILTGQNRFSINWPLAVVGLSPYIALFHWNNMRFCPTKMWLHTPIKYDEVLRWEL